MHATKHTPAARVRDFRVLLAVVTLALVVLACVGIQSIADRVSAPQARQAVAVQALAPAQAAATADEPGGVPLGFAIVVLVLAGGVVKLLSRVRSYGGRAVYWDDMPW